VLGDRDELGGLDFAPDRVMPAAQGLDARGGKIVPELSRNQQATTRYTIIAGYMSARVETGEPLATALAETCRRFEISERTAATAWAYTMHHVRERRPWTTPKVEAVL
jgi:hypothetical protein